MIEYTVKVYNNGEKCWYLDDKLHCEHGPAVERANGDKGWYRNGQRHCEHGPAFESAEGGKWWYLNNEYLTESEFNQRMNKSCSGMVVEVEGVKYKLVEV